MKPMTKTLTIADIKALEDNSDLFVSLFVPLNLTPQ